MAQPRAVVELQKTAQQKAEAHTDEEAHFEKTKTRELEIATQWEVLRQLSKKERVLSGSALKNGLKTVSDEAKDMAAGARTQEEMNYLKKQRKFLFLLGVPAAQAPILSYPTDTGKRKNFTPAQFCAKLGRVIDLYETGDEDLVKLLKPIEPLTKKLDEFKAFRGSKVTPYMQKYIAAEKARLTEMMKQVEKDVAAGLHIISKARKQKTTRKKSKGRGAAKPRWLKVGAKVWVADDDDLDEEADPCVWEAKVVKKAANRKVEGKMTTGWWSLDFGENVADNYDYIDYNIFGTEQDARLNLLVV